MRLGYLGLLAGKHLVVGHEAHQGVGHVGLADDGNVLSEHENRAQKRQNQAEKAFISHKNLIFRG